MDKKKPVYVKQGHMTSPVYPCKKIDKLVLTSLDFNYVKPCLDLVQL